MSLLIVGYTGLTHVGASFARAAEGLGLQPQFVDAERGFAAHRLVRHVAWHLRDHRPPALRALSAEVVSACARLRPRWLLTTGLAPIDASALQVIGKLGIQRLNFLTDDPWNPSLRAGWFFEALREYDRVFSPREANLDDLARHGCGAIAYLPFGFDPELSFPQEPSTAAERAQLAADVAFVGGADRDRVSYIDALIRTGLRVAVYGGYWDRFPETRRHARGHADLTTVRKVTSAASVSLCLVRRANRDGHVMRTFEIAAMRGCMLVEDTSAHRALFGPHGEAVAYFRTVPEMLDEVRWLVRSKTERQRMAAAAYQRVHAGRNTYADRLRTLLNMDEAAEPQPAAILGSTAE
jgi:spore maturation protein CgeB